jgi:amino acid transporter
MMMTLSLSSIKRFLIGEPLRTKFAKHQKVNVPMGLAIFAADALSSSAYATDEVLIALNVMLPGVAASAVIQQLAMPVAVAIVWLILLVVISYQQVIRAYPSGGGSYIVSRSNLGEGLSLVAGSALLIDYVLTVSVSICAGVGAMVSAGWIPHELQVPVAVGADVLILGMNLRGLKESASVFLLPSFLFIGAMAFLLISALYQMFTGSLHILHPEPVAQQVAGSGLGLFLACKLFFNGFSHGCAGLTGIEAVSNGVNAFKEPASKNANVTMMWMGTILAAIFIGMTYFAVKIGVVPIEGKNVVSQLATAVFVGQPILFNIVMFAVMLILILAANTAYSDFPRVSSFLADDGFLPRQLMSIGDRLVFSNGIIMLGIISMLLIIFFKGDTHALIPLYSVGVFICFTLTQLGLVRHHLREREKGWQLGMLINGMGAVITGMVLVVLAVEKFLEGAWLVFIAIPLLIYMFKCIKNHYKSVGRQLALPEATHCPVKVEHTVLVLVASLNRGTIAALEYAKSISERVEAVHVELKPEATQRLRHIWDDWGCGLPLTILKSPYRTLVNPLMDYIDEVEGRYDHDLVTIVIPEFVTKKMWHNILHNQTAFYLKAILSRKKGKVVTTVRYHLEE